jgi:hypothetical protein
MTVHERVAANPFPPFPHRTVVSAGVVATVQVGDYDQFCFSLQKWAEREEALMEPEEREEIHREIDAARRQRRKRKRSRECRGRS